MGGVASVCGWLCTDNRDISVQLNLTGTATGAELGNSENYGNLCEILVILISKRPGISYRL